MAALVSFQGYATGHWNVIGERGVGVLHAKNDPVQVKRGHTIDMTSAPAR